MQSAKMILTAITAAFVCLTGTLPAHADPAADRRTAQLIAWETLAQVGHVETVEEPSERVAVDLPERSAVEAYLTYARSEDRPEEVRGTYLPVQGMLRHRVEELVGDEMFEKVWEHIDLARVHTILNLDPMEGQDEVTVAKLQEALATFVEASLPQLREDRVRPDLLRQALAEAVVAAVATHRLRTEDDL